MQLFRNLQVIIVFTALLTTSFITNAYNPRSEEKIENLVPVIIQFEGLPILPYKTQMRSGANVNRALYSYADAMTLQHRGAREELSKRIPGIRINHDYTKIFNGMALEVPERYMENLKNFPGIISIKPDEPVDLMLSDSVPIINADDVWQQTNETGHTVTGKDVVVSVIDTGIDYNHPDLGGGLGPGYRVIGGYDYANSDSDPMDDHDHGTHVAGTIGANGTVTGVAPDVSFLAYKVLNNYGRGLSSWIVAGIEASMDPDGDPATDDAADIISMSLGAGGNPNDAMSQAVDNAFNGGAIVVVSAGNSGDGNGTIGSPGVAREALTVGAVEKDLDLASFSSRGPTSILEIKPNVVAPGVNIESTVVGGDHEAMSGTSMAAPHVSGVAALVIQAHRNWDQNVTRAAIVNTATDLGYFVNWEGNGMVDALEAVQAEAVLLPEDLTFGIVDSGLPMWYQEKELSITSTSDATATYDLWINMTNYPGVTTSLNTSQVVLGPGETVSFTLNLTVDNSQAMERHFQGRVVANSSTENISAPFYFIKKYLSVIASPDPSNGDTSILVTSPLNLASLDVEVTLPDSSTETVIMNGFGKSWNGTFTVTQHGLHHINATSVDINGWNNSGNGTLMGDIIPPVISATADPSAVDLFTYINVTSNENTSGFWWHDQRVTDNDNRESAWTRTAMDSNGIVHLVWMDDAPDGINRVHYMRYIDGSWVDRQIISNSSSMPYARAASFPMLAVDRNDFVHVIFEQNVFAWHNRLYYTKINGSNGTVVIPYKDISDVVDFRLTRQVAQDMAVDSANRIHATGSISLSGAVGEYFTLDENGDSLQLDTNVSARTIAIDNGDGIHINYFDNDDMFYYRYDAGAMLDFKRITQTAAMEINSEMQIDPENNVHVVYTTTQYHLYYTKRSFGNGTWSNPILLSILPNWYDSGWYFPSMFVEDGGNVHVISNRNNRITYNRYEAFLHHWEPVSIISSGNSPVHGATLTMDKDFNMYAVWNDKRVDYNWEVYMARYQSSPYLRIVQPDGSELMRSMVRTDAQGMNFSRIFYPTQDGLHTVNVTARDLAGNYAYTEVTFDAFIPPEVQDPSPSDGASTTNTTPLITAELWDHSGVNTSSVVLIVNGTDVTADAIITPSLVSYQPTVPLSLGPVNVSLFAEDIHGNAMPAPFNWTFDILEEPPSPTGLRVDLVQDDLIVTWTAPNFPEIDHYLVYKSFSLNGFNYSTPYHNTSNDANPLSTTFMDPDAASDHRTVYYAVRVVDINNNNDSNEDSVWNGDWVVVNSQYVSNADHTINGNITIMDGGSLSLDNVTVRMNSTGAVRYEIRTDSVWWLPSSVHFSNNSIITRAADEEYDIDLGYFSYFSASDTLIEKGGEFTSPNWNIVNTQLNLTIRDFGVVRLQGDGSFDSGVITNATNVYFAQGMQFTNSSVNNCSSIQVTFGSPLISNNRFADNNKIRFNWGTSPSFIDNVVKDSAWTGIDVVYSDASIENTTFINNPTTIQSDGSTIMVINSTIIGGDNHFLLSGDSHVTALNTTFNESKLIFVDDLSTLTVQWFMDVHVVDAIGEPAVGVTVTVTHDIGLQTDVQSTNSMGRVEYLRRNEGVWNKTLFISHDPHNVSAVFGPVTGYADPEPVMDGYQLVQITLDVNMPPVPPSNLIIHRIVNDLRLSWDPSPSSDVAGYHIFRATSPDSFDLDAPWINTSSDSDDGILPLRTSWNITDGVLDSNTYFYIVRAFDGAGNNDSNVFKVGKFVIAMEEGWNLISIPLVLYNRSIDDVFYSIAGLYDVIQYYNNFDGLWHTTNTDLTHVDNTMGLWVHMNTPANLVVIGDIPSATMLYLSAFGRGFNLMGYPSLEPMNASDVFFQLTGYYDSVYTFDPKDGPDPWKLFHTGKPALLNDLPLMEPGKGYWVRVYESTAITIW